jgi:transcriptional regulator with GAF, ATPase, and Fis domain
MSTVASGHLADVLTEVARVLHQPMPVEKQLGLVLQAATDTIPGLDAASITVLDRRSGPKTVAATEALVYELDQVQYDLDEGPCLDALRREPFQRIDDMPAEQRWPRYAAKAADAGIRAQMALELYNDEHSMGGLNLYSRHLNAFDEETRHAAWLFATHAALAMGHEQLEESLNQALITRKVIGQAIGAVMQRFELDEDRAFQFLVRTSNTSNIKLRDVAQQIVDELNAKAHAKG